MHTHTHIQRHTQAAVCSNTQRWTTEISVLFDICNDKIQPNERAPRLLARSVARSLVHSLFSWNHLTLVDRTFIMNNFIFLPFCSYMSNVYTSSHIILWLFISVVQQRIPIISACNFQLFFPPSLSFKPTHSHTHSKWQNEQIQFNNVVNMKINSKWARSSKMLLENPFE